MLAFITDLELSIFSTLPELLRQMSLWENCRWKDLPTRQNSIRAKGKKAQGHTDPNVTEVVDVL